MLGSNLHYGEKENERRLRGAGVQRQERSWGMNRPVAGGRPQAESPGDAQTRHEEVA